MVRIRRGSGAGTLLRRLLLPAWVVLMCACIPGTCAPSAESRLAALRIPEVNFRDATAGATIDFIVETVRDSEKGTAAGRRGTRFVVSLTEEEKARQLTLRLRDVSALTLLRTATSSAGVPCRIGKDTVVIGRSAESQRNRLMVRVYRFPVHMATELRKAGAKEYLEGFGVTFPPGTSARYSGAASRLTVLNTVDAIDRLDRSLGPLGAIPVR